MSYLDVPRLHFAGNFRADPSTINNLDSNFDPNATLQPVWNPYGTHVFQFRNCAVRSAVDSSGNVFGPGSTDPLIGVSVISTDNPYPAKIVDLDVDQQTISQIFGLQVQIIDPTNRQSQTGFVTGDMQVVAFSDLWIRLIEGRGMPAMSAVYQSVLENLQWGNTNASPILTQLRQISPQSLSIKFIVDSYQTDSNQESFTYGRVVSSIGPVFPNEPAHFMMGRRLSAPNSPQGLPLRGAVFAKLNSNRNRLIIDLGNMAPTERGQATTPPPDGWPVKSVQLRVYGFNPTAAARAKSGASTPSEIPVGEIQFTQELYTSSAGIVELPVDPDQIKQLAITPLVVEDITTPGSPHVKEDSQGRYVDVSTPFLRMNPGDSATVVLTALKFGQPAPKMTLGLNLIGGNPPEAIRFPSQVITDDSGQAVVTFQAFDPGNPRQYIDGQVYLVGGDWQNYGNIFVAAGAPISVMVFSEYPIPDNPVWTEHVMPILSQYARLYPYMTTILDLSSYDDVVRSIDRVRAVLLYPIEDPHHMPVVRDLSAGKLATILKWIANGMPQGPTPSRPSVA